MKKTVSFLLIFLSFSMLFAKPRGALRTVRVGVLNGPTCIPASYMMENDTDATFETFADPQTLLPKMIKKEIDVGFMPVNVAAKVYNSGNKAILCAAITGLGNLSLITTDPELRRFSDLKGKEVYMAGQGATPEYMMRYILDENNLSYEPNGDLSLIYSIPTAQIAAQLISGKIKYAVVPEPFATIAAMKSKTVRVALDLQKEYLELSGAKEIYPLSVMVVRADFAKENPELFESFLSEYEKSVTWTIKNPGEAATLSEKHNLGLSAAIVSKSIPMSNYVYIPAENGISMIEDILTIFINCDSTSIGGKLPDRDFYYEGKKQQ